MTRSETRSAVQPEETASPDGAPREVRPSSSPDQVQR